MSRDVFDKEETDEKSTFRNYSREPSLRPTPLEPAISVRLGEMSVLYIRQSTNKGSEKRQGPALDVRFTEVSRR